MTNIKNIPETLSSNTQMGNGLAFNGVGNILIMKLIPLIGKFGKGKFAQVDDESFEYLMQWNWTCTANGHVYRTVFLHKHLIGITNSHEKIVVDRKDRNPLNNQKSNLRACSMLQNSWNRTRQKHGASKYKGVRRHQKKQKLKDGSPVVYVSWSASIRYLGKSLFLGNFPYTPEGESLAGRAYDKAAKHYFGEFANLNFKENENI